MNATAQFQVLQDATMAQSLRKRDLCSDAFGSGWTDGACTPGNTLCCVNEDQTYPQCQQYLGLGYCCVGFEEGCYIDISSSCGQPGAVSCPESQLAPGVDEVCCPQDYACATGYELHTDWVRCNIDQTAIQALAAATMASSASGIVPAATNLGGSDVSDLPNHMTSSTQSTSTSSTISTISTSSATMSATNPPSESTVSTRGGAATETNAPSSGGSNLSGGDIAGIAIGPVGAVLLALLLFWVFRRRKQQRAEQSLGQQAPSQTYQDSVHPSMQFSPSYGAAALAQPYYGQQGAVSMDPKELPGGASPTELQTSKPYGTSYPAAQELEGTHRS